MNARAALLLAGFALAPLAGAQHAGHAPAVPQPHGGAEFARFADEMNAGMGRMMRDMHTPGYTENPDIDFLAMMVPHHEGAVEMARLVLVHGRDPATRRLAEDIIASQTVEIEAMRRRLALLRGAPAAREAQFPELGGTRGPAPAH
jgi:hypothetical protein